MTLKDIKDKIVHGDFKSLIYPGTTTDIHPSDVAKIMDTLPVDIAFNSFAAFPEKKKPLLFAYVGHFLQRKIINRLSKEQASYVLNHLDSTDRYAFFISLGALERSQFIEYLDDKNKKARN